MIEHLALEIPISLRAFCECCRKILDLPDFTYDSDNETEWGIAQLQDCEFNVSRPYELGTLQEWDDSVPDGCNTGISLIVDDSHPHGHDHHWAFSHLVAPHAQRLANEFNILVHFHRTWFGPGNNVARSTSFHPTVS
jgi:hypothetical protein